MRDPVSMSAVAMMHSDPFDRLILATARVEGLTVVSSDRQFALYDVALIDARR
jgi:PIN domain nuclease of toxin-antitoxin system